MSRKVLFFLLILGPLPVVFLRAHPGRLTASHPAPSKYCTGMAFDGRFLWVADHEAGRIFKVDPATGKTGGSIPSPGRWPTGLAFDGKSLWNADAGSRKLFRIDPADGSVLETIDAPTRSPEGLAFDGKTLWIGDSREGKIVKIDLSDGTAVKSFPAPARSADGLAFDGTWLWCADRLNDEIDMIDPENGEVILVADSPGPYPRGMAFDGVHIWCVDYQKDEIDRLVRRDEEAFVLEDPRRARITLTHRVTALGGGGIKSLDVFLAVPAGSARQKILGVSFSPPYRARGLDRFGQSVARFSYEKIAPGSPVESVMTVDAEISGIRYFIFPDLCGTLGDIPETIRKLYTADGSKLMTRDPFIRGEAKRLAGDERNPYVIARRIFDYVRGALSYKLEGGWNAAPVVLKRGTGSCSEYAFAFIALCRAAGVPARYAGAIVVRGDDACVDDVFHRWAEIYLPGYGWIPVDPQGGDRPLPRDRALAIGNLSNRFLVTTLGGGDSELLGWYYNETEKYVAAPKTEVKVEAFAAWDPLPSSGGKEKTSKEGAAPGKRFRKKEFP